MVMTKGDLIQIKEAMKDQITEYFQQPQTIAFITENINNTTKVLIENLESKLSNKFMELENKYSAIIEKLEESFKADIASVKQSNETLFVQINNDRIKFENDLGRIYGKIHDLECEDNNVNSKLNEAYGIIDCLKGKIEYLEKSAFHNEQHGRKWNIEIDGIPINIGDDRLQLEKAVLELLRSINVKCQPEDIEAVHRLPSKGPIKPTIVRFNHRKTVEDINLNKHKLKDISSLKIDITGLTEDSKIYINPSLSKYYKKKHSIQLPSVEKTRINS